MVDSLAVRDYIKTIEEISNFLDKKPYGEIRTLMIISSKSYELDFKLWFYNEYICKGKMCSKTMEDVYENILLSSMDALSALKRKMEWCKEVDKDMI